MDNVSMFFKSVTTAVATATGSNEDKQFWGSVEDATGTERYWLLTGGDSEINLAFHTDKEMEDCIGSAGFRPDGELIIDQSVYQLVSKLAYTLDVKEV